MMDQGIWILAMVLVIGKHEVIIKPYEVYPSQQICLTMRDIVSRQLDVQMTCMQQAEG